MEKPIRPAPKIIFPARYWKLSDSQAYFPKQCLSFTVSLYCKSEKRGWHSFSQIPDNIQAGPNLMTTNFKKLHFQAVWDAVDSLTE